MLGGIAEDQHGLPAVRIHELVERSNADLELVARHAILVPHIGPDDDAGLNGAHRLSRFPFEAVQTSFVPAQARTQGHLRWLLTMSLSFWVPAFAGTNG